MYSIRSMQQGVNMGGSEAILIPPRGTTRSRLNKQEQRPLLTRGLFALACLSRGDAVLPRRRRAFAAQKRGARKERLQECQ
jgi:hypothetical protein